MAQIVVRFTLTHANDALIFPHMKKQIPIMVPPAKSPVSLLKFLKMFLSYPTQNKAFLFKEWQITGLWAGDSWIKTLALLFRALKAQKPGLNKIVLPAYTCNEFVKAIILADCIPYFVDCDQWGNISRKTLEQLNHTEILAVLIVNNTGICHHVEDVADWCKEAGIFSIEDAGYTIGGATSSGANLGNIGDFTIINTSEGKWFCIGGGIIVVKNNQLVWDWILNETKDLKRTRFIADLIAMFIYKMGSSKLGYTLYYYLKMLGLGDLKQRFSREPTRIREDYARGDILQNGDGHWQLKEEYYKTIQQNTMRRWGTFRWVWASQQWKMKSQYQSLRFRKYEYYLRELPEGSVFPFQSQAFLIKVPIALNDDVPKSVIAEWDKIGINKQYPATWPMAKLPFANASCLYKYCYTLPIHEDIEDVTLKKIVETVRPYAISLSKASTGSNS